MAIEDYWASTARNAKDVAQYLIFPATKILGTTIFPKNAYASNLLAGVATSAFYTGLTELFMGREMSGFDHVAHMAVAAELGKDPNDLKFSDYMDSENCVIKKRMQLFNSESWQRYPVSLLPMMPIAMEHVARNVRPEMQPRAARLREGENRYRAGRVPYSAPAIEHLLEGWKLWDTVVFAGVAMLWLKETFGTDKTFIYQTRKEMELHDELGLKIEPNNMMGLYNRMRNDCDLPMIYKENRDAIWPLFELLAEKVNNSSLGLPELTYLMGLGKLDVFAKDAAGKEIHDESGKMVIDKKAWENAMAEIAHVEKVGLKGIIEESKANPQKKPAKAHSFVENLGRVWYDTHFAGYTALFGSKRDKDRPFSEQISPRDPGEVPHYMV